MNNLVEVKNVSVGYSNKIILTDVSFTVCEHDFLGIIGPNGGGKTTLLKLILGLLPPARGKITFFQEGEEVTSLKMGYLPQMNQIDRDFPIKVREVIASGLVSEKPAFRAFNQEQNRRIDAIADQMGVAGLTERPIRELSGGQLQRVLLGRALVSQPKVLILDEPNSYLDKQFESEFYNLLTIINQESAIIFVSHDVDKVRTLAKRILSVENGTLTLDA